MTTNEIQHMNNTYILGGVSLQGLLITFIPDNTQTQLHKPICMSTQEAISYNECSLQLLPLHATSSPSPYSCDSEDSKTVESVHVHFYLGC